MKNRQQGISLLESLLALLVLALGLLALARVQTHLRAGADAARERSEAVRLAQQDLERLRTFATPAGWSAIADTTAIDVTPPGSPTRYTLARAVQTRAEPPLKAVRVTLQWNDRHGAAQALQLDTLIAGGDPALAGALAIPRPPL